MSHNIRFKVDELRENDPTKEAQSYPGGSNVRNVCFVQPDGKMLFLSYGYLVSGEYLPDESEIVLSFTSHTITLKGTKLQELFFEFLSHKPKTVVCENERFQEISDKQNYFVTAIRIESTHPSSKSAE